MNACLFFFRFEKLNQHIIITKMAWTPAVIRLKDYQYGATYSTINKHLIQRIQLRAYEGTFKYIGKIFSFE